MGRYSTPTQGQKPWWRTPPALAGATVLIAAGATVGVASLVSGVGTNSADSTPMPMPTASSGETDTTETVADASTAPVEETQTCASLDPVRIAAAAAKVPVLEDVAEQACVDLVLTQTSATSGAADLAAGTVDVWIPDSREYAIAAGADAAAAAPSTAWSPIVMAAESGTAAQVALSRAFFRRPHAECHHSARVWDGERPDSRGNRAHPGRPPGQR